MKEVAPHPSVLEHLRSSEQGDEKLHSSHTLPAFLSYWQVPSQRNLFFTGREPLLHQLRQLLCQQQPAALTPSIALSGMAGIGKTATALEYAYRYFQDYSAVFWVEAETYENLTVSFVSLAHLLDLPEKRERDQSKVVAAALGWLNTHGDWLLILDNVEDLELVKRFLPAARGGSLLFTTRMPTLFTLAYCIKVEPMPLEEGIQLLLRRSRYGRLDASRHQLSPREEAVVRTLVTAMDGLPLALDQAASYIEKTQCSLSDFLRLFRLFPVQLLHERDRGMDHPVSVARTFALSFEQLQKTNSAAADLLIWCCFLASDAIPEELITQSASMLPPPLQAAASSPWQWNALLSDLLAYSLLRRNQEARMLSIHRLVQTVLKEGLPEATQKHWVQRVVHTLSQAFSLDQHTLNVERWPWCEQVLPHALLAISQAERWQLTSPAYICLLAKTATYLSQRARYPEAEALYQRALSVQEQSQGSAHPELAGVLTGLANTYHKQGKYHQSETAYRRAISLLEADPASDDLHLTFPLQGLAFLCFERSRYQEAEHLYQRVLCLRQQALPEAHPDLATVLGDLAALYDHQGRFQEAEPLLLRALQMREQSLSANHPDLAESLNTLALLYFRRGLYTKAEPLYLRALCIYEQALGPNHPNIGVVLHNLSVLYRNQDRDAEAEPLVLRAVLIREHIFGPDHPYTAFFVDNLAVLYRKQGRYQEAEHLHRRVLQIYEQTHEPDHPVIADTLSNLVQLFCEQGREKEAQALALRALRIREQAYQPNHPYRGKALHNLATVYFKQGRHQEAETLYLRALQIFEQALSPGHPDTARLRDELATLYIQCE